jgi:hypothetical protein
MRTWAIHPATVWHRMRCCGIGRLAAEDARISCSDLPPVCQPTASEGRRPPCNNRHLLVKPASNRFHPYCISVWLHSQRNCSSTQANVGPFLLSISGGLAIRRPPNGGTGPQRRGHTGQAPAPTVHGLRPVRACRLRRCRCRLGLGRRVVGHRLEHLVAARASAAEAQTRQVGPRAGRSHSVNTCRAGRPFLAQSVLTCGVVDTGQLQS